MSTDPLRPKSSSSSPPWLSLVGIGFELTAWVVVPLLVGLWLDRRYGWAPWAAVAGGTLGSIGGLTILIVRAYSAQARSDTRSAERHSE